MIPIPAPGHQEIINSSSTEGRAQSPNALETCVYQMLVARLKTTIQQCEDAWVTPGRLYVGRENGILHYKRYTCTPSVTNASVEWVGGGIPDGMGGMAKRKGRVIGSGCLCVVL
jgi:hypothetical protein